ncbi:TraB/GumN family protein [Roseateles sp.]|uniref:TraB/GumN family protein n=1 Tax=Roseateles sp. TaxID=1971397 RepID=UPI0025E37E5D|nr:TraB/GumN family protein [Roseateles sp.]MBV8035978.1 TraB/GumN family protein [Roseateles sp.]
MIRPLLLSLALLAGGAHAACPPVPTLPDAGQAAAWATGAPDRGLLWRISRGGHSSYLFGSLHVGKADWAYPGPALRAAWAATEVLAVELDPADVGAALATRPQDEAPAPAQARQIEAQARAACLPPGALSALPVMLQLATLTLLEARRDGFDPGFGQEQMLLAWARREGRPVQSLESVEEQLDALAPEAAELPAVVDGTLRQLRGGQVRAPLRKLATAWSRGDLKTLADYPRWCACADTAAERAWLKRVNDDRNVLLAARITALHGAGQRLLVAVGALHMSGPQALPRLLAAEGFDVEALWPSK